MGTSLKEMPTKRLQRGVKNMSVSLYIAGLVALSFTLLAECQISFRNRERSGEHRIKEILLRQYDATSRPVRDDTTPVKVQIAISLYHILDTNEREQTFTCLLAIRQRWTDEYLRWNSSDFGGVESIRIPADKIWTPDLIIQNFAGDKFNDYMVTNAIISPDGTVLWLFPALIKTSCTLNVKYFPFDTQNCNITFISWTHSGEQVDIFYNESMANTVYYASTNQEWAVSKNDILAERHEKKYACCPELYPDVTFTIRMRRGSLFYIINLITPCFLIFVISFLGFFLPVESGEKVNLEITILLALVVFMLRVGETMPPTPDSIPILGMYFASTMAMVSIALVMAVIVTNIYAKKNSPERCPVWAVRVASKFFPSNYLPERQLSSASLSSTLCGDKELALTLSGAVSSSASYDRLSRVRKTHDADSSTNGRSLQQLQQSANRRGGGGGFQPRSTSSGGVVSEWNDHVTRTGAAERRAKRMQRSAASSSCESSAGRQSSVDSNDVTQEKYEKARAKAEWRLVALFADRFFLWVFTGLSLTVHISLIVQMLPRDS